jgi:hypothetical protein
MISLQVNFTVIVRAAATGRDAINNPVKIAWELGERFRLRDVGKKRMDASGFQFPRRAPPQAKNLMALPDQFHSQRQANVTAADNQALHLPFTIFDLRFTRRSKIVEPRKSNIVNRK